MSPNRSTSWRQISPSGTYRITMLVPSSLPDGHFSFKFIAPIQVSYYRRNSQRGRDANGLLWNTDIYKAILSFGYGFFVAFRSQDCDIRLSPNSPAPCQTENSIQPLNHLRSIFLKLPWFHRMGCAFYASCCQFRRNDNGILTPIARWRSGRAALLTENVLSAMASVRSVIRCCRSLLPEVVVLD